MQLILLFGGNIGDVLQTFEAAKSEIQQKVGSITKVSSLYESEAWGFEAESNFVNQVIECRTKLSPGDVLRETMEIEKKLGRIRKLTSDNTYSSRIIDIDILYYNQDIINQEELTIPHPKLHLRNFTLQPLAEIVPEYNHPIFNKSSKELLTHSKDTSNAWLLNA